MPTALKALGDFSNFTYINKYTKFIYRYIKAKLSIYSKRIK